MMGGGVKRSPSGPLRAVVFFALDSYETFTITLAAHIVKPVTERAQELKTGCFACPHCGHEITSDGEWLRCDGCGRAFRDHEAYLDLRHTGVPEPRGFGPRLMRVKLFARVYERYWRPTFVSVAMGGRADMVWEQNHVSEFFDTAPDGDILDLCCGPGFMARYLASRSDRRRIYALDASPPMIVEAADRYRHEGGSPIIWLLGDVEKLPFAGASLGAIHAGACLHVLPAPAAAIKEAARVLKPGGVFFASTFIRPDDSLVARGVQRSFDRLASIHIFSDAELRCFVEEAGLEGFEAVVRGGFVYLTARKPAD